MSDRQRWRRMLAQKKIRESLASLKGALRDLEAESEDVQLEVFELFVAGRKVWDRLNAGTIGTGRRKVG